MEFDREKTVEELKIARELLHGPGVPANLFTEEIFPYLYNFARESFDVLKAYAEMGIADDKERIDLFRDLPKEIRLWPDDKERALLFIASNLGVGDKALEMLKQRHLEIYKERRGGF